MSELYLGLDIGGTKCSVILGKEKSGHLEVIDKIKFLTVPVDETIDRLIESADNIIRKNKEFARKVRAAGISCGGPLDSRKGIIMSPPNLPGWDNIPIVEILSERLGVPVFIQNDANACALAEWRYGAGQGVENMIFLTFGTGLGAGLILNGRLYSGNNDNAGEIGHVRLADFGPVGYGKAGSFEGFCSGSGMVQIAQMLVKERLQMGISSALCPEYADMSLITAKKIVEYASKGDEVSAEVCRITGEYLGRGISAIIDILNPELIVIGSIYERAGHLFMDQMNRVIDKEALPNSRKVCKIVPAKLGDSIGDIAALSVAVNLMKTNYE